MSATVTVSIGRNVEDVPMPLAEWRRFRADVRRALGGVRPYVSDARTIGEWAGVAEESRTWVAPIAAQDVQTLVASMADLATRYRQDAIAVTVGTTTLAA